MLILSHAGISHQTGVYFCGGRVEGKELVDRRDRSVACLLMPKRNTTLASAVYIKRCHFMLQVDARQYSRSLGFCLVDGVYVQIAFVLVYIHTANMFLLA